MANTSPGVGTWVTNRIGFWIAAAVVARETGGIADDCEVVASAILLVPLEVSVPMSVLQPPSSIERLAAAHRSMLRRATVLVVTIIL